MTRMSKEAKAVSNAKIIDEAARLFRENGFEATGVAEIMSAAGLTHGGFYRHFKSKEELATKAVGLAMKRIMDDLEQAMEAQGSRAALVSYIERYLSERHVTNPGMGCPIAALGAEASRGEQSFLKIVGDGYQNLVRLFMMGIGGDGDDARDKANEMLTILIGTVVIARTISEKSEMQKILANGLARAKAVLDK